MTCVTARSEASFMDRGFTPLFHCVAGWVWISSPYKEHKVCGTLKRSLAAIALIVPTLLTLLLAMFVVALRACCASGPRRITPPRSLNLDPLTPIEEGDESKVDESP